MAKVTARQVSEIILVASLYVITARIGFIFAIQPGNVTTIWPPSGISLAAALLLGNRIWPGIWLGSFIANLWFFTDISKLFSGGIVSTFIGIGSTMQAIIGAYLIKFSTGSNNPFRRTRNVFAFVGIEMAVCIIASSVGVTALYLAGFVQEAFYGHTLATWWTGDFIGVIAITPLAIISVCERLPKWHFARWMEITLFALLAVPFSKYVFPYEFFRASMFLLVAWAAFRYGRRIVTLSTILISAIVVWDIAKHSGFQILLPIQFYIGIVNLTGLFLSVGIYEEMATRELLEESRQNLERRVTERTSELVATHIDLEKEIAVRKIAEEKFRKFLQLAPDAIVIVNKNGKVITINSQAEKIFGYKESEIIGQPVEMLMPESYRSKHNVHRENYNSSPSARPMGTGLELYGRRKNGAVFPVEISLSPIETEEGTLIASAIRDITARKKMEEERIRLNTYLLQSQKMISIGQLSAGVAHEINNPAGYILSNMNTMEGYYDNLRSLLNAMSDALKRVASGEDPESIIEEIEKFKSGFDYEFLIDDFGKAIKESEEGTIKIRDIVKSLGRFVHPGDVKPVLCNINEEVHNAMRVCWNELKYKADVKTDLQELPLIGGYPQRISQLFVTLLVNAAQAIENNGEIDISSRVENGEAVIRIRDTGCGIPQKYIHSLFEPFFTTKPVGKGTGLGLYVAYQIVEEHKGKIEVQSEEGKGTEFTIRIPYNNKVLEDSMGK